MCTSHTKFKERWLPDLKKEGVGILQEKVGAVRIHKLW
jgi:hypothetical protein